MSEPVAGGTPDDEAAAFRAEFSAWLEDNLTPAVVAAAEGGGLEEAETFEILRDWNRTMADAGWAAPAWPVEHGGRAATIAEQLAWLEVMAAAGAPGAVNVIGVSNIAPAIMAVGTEEQKERYLAPDVARGRDLEPGHVGARRRLRPRFAADVGPDRRRHLRGERPEDLEQPRPATPTGASSTCAPTPTRPSTRASAPSWST